MNFAENKSGPRARSGVRPTKTPSEGIRGSKAARLKGLPLRADSLVWRPMVPQRLSIVVRRPPRNGFTDRVLGMPALQQLGFGLVASSWVSWMAGRWLRLKSEHREVTAATVKQRARSFLPAL
ncbi:uncharacterized protein FPOAC1_014103 [Fusarium poae]|uniref:uncharacterized protein n=1 Tax=Fusarium poae TaxID=36050 RepID=UPI001D0399FC|nr:uncharacterized protein FPOAC1_014103 [Fusarium poae]KAG8664079.1 hypothetical protein FPOAC1_014103 [Fusarium poae]